MKKYFFLSLLLFSFLTTFAQRTEIKNYLSKSKAGDVWLLYTYGDYSGAVSSRIYVVDAPKTDYYYISSLTNMNRRQNFKIYVDNIPFAELNPSADGWQFASVSSTAIKLAAGKHEIKFIGTDGMVPMVDELYLTVAPPVGREAIPETVTAFLDKVELLRQQPPIAASSQVYDDIAVINKVLPNPAGEYSHAIDTAFGYTHYSSVYLTAGSHTFTTSGSTVSRSLTIFNPSNYTYSWANSNSGPGGESGLYLYVGLAGYYSVMLRPTVNGTTGTTNIILDGNTLVSGAVIGGKTYSMSSLRGGDMNFFTCKLTAGDTRMVVSRFFSSSARGYNDDYYGAGGSWNWGLASRIKKTFNGLDSVQYSFVCSYSPTSTGVCDIYMGAGNSNLHQLEPLNFPLLTDDDAIRSAPQSGSYNCIAWSGGITSNWIWPPSSLSTYNCTSANYLQCFDNFYSNNPVRYPGAWNYTRTGATVNNSVVDLWKTASAYTHASVQKPGNNHPHGYDWESKPGGTNRTLHPRNALTQANWYGSVSNYYKPTGTFARNAVAENVFESDADAVKAGVAIFDRASLTPEANEKLSVLLQKANPSLTKSFNELYKTWDETKAANATLSDPAAYCKNRQYQALEKFSLSNSRTAMLMVFDKFIKGDHIIGELMLTLTMEKYSKLLADVKAERIANPNDAQGRYKIHGDHDNGVLYVEKILKSLEEEIIAEPVTETIAVTVSPNPVADKLTVQVIVKKPSKVSIAVVSLQTGEKQLLQKETTLIEGTHRFQTSIKDMARSNDNILVVQVTVDGIVKTIKVLVAR